VGFESFQIELHGGHATCLEAEGAIRTLERISIDHDAAGSGSSRFFVMNDGKHVVEIELKHSPPVISCRFTLCHPPSIDAVFLGLVRQLMVLLGMHATIRDDVRPEHAHSFTLDAFDELAAATLQYIHARRLEWIEMCGTEQLAATTSEVFQRIICPQCQP
jgi:hypothetical protein